MNAGKLDKRIAIYRVEQGKTPSGAPKDLLVRERFTWANIETQGLTVAAEGDRTQPVSSYHLLMRARKSRVIEFGDWVQYGVTWMKVIGVDSIDSTSLIVQCESNPNEQPPSIKVTL